EAVSDLSAQSIEAQRGAGAGLTVQGFERAMAAGEIASLEPQEVCYLLADTVGWQLEQVLVNVEPVLARDRLKSENFSIDKGQVIGLRTSCRGMVSGREVVRITVETALGTPDRASIYLDGTPPVSLTLPSGLQSADSTAALIISCLPFMARSQSPLGLLTLRDLPLIPYWRKKTVSAGEQHPL
ncbi:MAG TPA: hypothetical protein VNL15_00565, partial [Dehalococcoidia bacterium]|nr:hypothetical protein [Dehalococcoidia bacterium]